MKIESFHANADFKDERIVRLTLSKLDKAERVENVVAYS